MSFREGSVTSKVTPVADAASLFMDLAGGLAMYHPVYAVLPHIKISPLSFSFFICLV